MALSATRYVRAVAMLSAILLLAPVFPLWGPGVRAETAVYPVTSETMTRGTSDGFTSQDVNDNVANVKTEAGTTGNMWLIPNGDDGPNQWQQNCFRKPAPITILKFK